MPTPPTGADAGRARLTVEFLEDRSVPTAVPFDPTHVLVTVTDPAATATVAALPSATPIGPGLYRIGLAPALSVAAAVDGLSRVHGVEAQPDYRVTPAAIPNDPTYPSQWGHRTIGAASAWDAGHGTGQTVVAVIDSGIDYRHPDLAANLWRNPREVAGNGRDDDGNGFIDDVFGADFANNDGDPFDDFGHGTGVAGVIGATGNNSLGVAGVAWTTHIMALKFMGADGSGSTSNAIRALDYAVANGAKVVNFSWGHRYYDPALASAVARAREAGVIVVAAAGNYSSDNDRVGFYPANLDQQSDNVIAVAATDSSDLLASFSNFGRTTATVAAPGVSVWTTQTGGRYAPLSGTSVAAPYVTGAIAVTWDANPTWTYRQVMGKLGWSVDTLGPLTGRIATNGRLNLDRMVHPPPVVPPPTTMPAPPSTSNGSGPRVVSASLSGPTVAALDRVRVTFSEPVNPATFTASTVSVIGPAGPASVSAVLPTAGRDNTEFTLVLSQRQTTAGAYTATIGPGIRSAAGHALDQNGNGVGGEADDRFTTTATIGSPPANLPEVSPAAPTVGRITYAAAGMPKPIQDRRTTRIDFAVTGDFRIGDLNIELDITHGRVRDLSVRVVAPDGRVVTLFNRRGGTGANLSATVFDDAAAVSVGAMAAPFRGSVQPEQSLSRFNGMSARGVWSVQVFDLADGMAGTVNRAALHFAPQVAGQSVSAMGLTEPSKWAPLTYDQIQGANGAFRDGVLHGRADAVASATPKRW